MIRVHNLSKRYGTNRVLDSIELEFCRGKVYGIVGENGAGKTTLFRCMAGLEAYEGKVITTSKPLKDHLGFLSAEPYFFTKITGKEYLQLLCMARGVNDLKFQKKNIYDLPLNQYISTFSTGMRKKLAIMGILLQNNQYFILDEPFNGLDIHSHILTTEIILELKKLQKVAIVSSHIFTTLTDICDEIILLEKGKVSQIYKAPMFGELEKEMKIYSIGERITGLNLK